MDEAEIQALNKQYRGHDRPTNVLSFPSEIGLDLKEFQHVLGDLVICAPVIAKEAKAQQKSMEAHFAHMVIHGVLHLLGYDHQDDTQAHAMEALEVNLLNDLGFEDPFEATYDKETETQ